MSDILQTIQWAEDTIENRLMFGMDDLNAALVRESRARGVLSECAEVIKSKDQGIQRLKDALRDMSDALDLWNETGDTQTIENAAREALSKNKELLEEINKEKE